MSAPRPPLPFRLLAIGDRRQATPAAVRAAAEAGGSRLAILLRDPSLTDAERLAWTLEVLPVCRERGALLLVHGSAAVALAAGADGVHLPQRVGPLREVRRTLGPGALLGASRHDGPGVLDALRAGADYATLSPIFPTPGKGPALGMEQLAEACGAAPGRVVALGGIVAGRAGECFEAGAAAVAAVRGVWAGEVGENVRWFLA